MSGYAKSIGAELRKLGAVADGIDPRHVEAWMRLEHPTLDGLSPAQFATEVRAGFLLVRASGSEESERLARSEGL